MLEGGQNEKRFGIVIWFQRLYHLGHPTPLLEIIRRSRFGGCVVLSDFLVIDFYDALLNRFKKNSAIHSRSQRVAKKSAPHHRDYFSRFSDFNQLGCLYLHRLHRPSPASQPRLLHQSVVKCFSRRLLSERTVIKTSQASESGRIDRRRFTNDSNWSLPYQLAAASYELLSLRLN